MAFRLPGTRVPHRKNTLGKPTVRIEAPKSVTIPMAMHIGKPAIPAVKVGDLVKVGTLIGTNDGTVSAKIYSSVSGKVTKLIEYLQSNGEASKAVVIESDGEMTPEDGIMPPEIATAQDMIDAIANSGIVGLGGAGFPTHVKFMGDLSKIDHIIVNGAECEPHVASDNITMLTRADDIARAIEAIGQYFGIKSVIIGIENNKKDAIATMEEMAVSIKSCSVKVRSLPSVYPQGGEKVIVYHTTGRRIPLGKLPMDVGCIVINCTTLASIGAYLKTGMPLVEKCVSVDGGAVKNPQNVIAPIGTPIKDLFDFCGGLTEQPAKLIYGGPMMGITVPNTDAPVLKNTNAVLALTEKESKLPKTTACINCGSCSNTCPFGLAPVSISKAYDNGSVEDLIALHVEACMECGCCSYVCPANRPLLQKNKLSKALVKETRAKENNK